MLMIGVTSLLLPWAGHATDPKPPPPDADFLEYLGADDPDPELAKYLAKDTDPPPAPKPAPKHTDGHTDGRT
jgi:hypothetical protein